MYTSTAIAAGVVVLVGMAAVSLAPPDTAGLLLLCSVFLAIGLIAAAPLVLRGLAPLFAQVEEALGHIRDVHGGSLKSSADLAPPSDGINIGRAVSTMLEDLGEKARSKETDAERAERLVSRLINAQEAERKQLAALLKEGAGDIVGALAVGLDRLGQHLDDPARARTELSRLKRQTARTIAGMRQLVLELRPALLDDLGLAAATRWYVLEKVEMAGLRAVFHAPGLEQRRFASSVEIGLFRIVEEALRNVLQHSGATEVRVEFALRDGYLTASVTDDGRGFDVETASASEQGVGILALEQRAALLGGSLSITSRPGQTRVAVDVPAAESSPRDSGTGS